MSHSLASSPPALQVSAMVVTPNGLQMRTSSQTSRLLPLRLIASSTSPARTTPRSPCAASTGWMNWLGVPVEVRVAAILRATMPLLPRPVTDAAGTREQGAHRARERLLQAGGERLQSVGFLREDPAAEGDDLVVSEAARRRVHVVSL